MTRFPVLALGESAAAALRGGDGHVAALFDHSFYVLCGGNWVCIGTDALPMGPLNARCAALAETSWPDRGVRLDDRVVIAPGVCHVGGRLAFPFADATIWRPPPVPAWAGETLRAGLGNVVGGEFPPGLAGLAARRAIAAIGTLSSGIAGDAPLSGRAAGAVSALLGLGPGLTPSGDDFLGGMMIALHALGRTARAAELSNVIGACAPRLTNPISAAHLKAAGEGRGAEPLHRVINDVLAGRDVSLAGIDRIGHTSGRDALAGAISVLRTALGRIQSGVIEQRAYHHAE